MENNRKRKLIILGIDGGTFKVIDPLIEEKKMPNLERLVTSGVKGILKSTYPPITAAAWVSFMTGKNPGKHGFFDFREYNPNEYILSNIPMEKDAVDENVSNLHSSRFHGQTIWDFLSAAGYENNIVAVPMTYPPWKIKGRMVAGYPSPDYDKPKTYPPEWSDEIGRIFNMSAINYSKLDGFISECKELVKRKGRIVLEQLRNNKGDVFAVVFSSSDFAQHYFWKYIKMSGHAYANVIGEIYQEIDKVIGEILRHCDDDTSVAVMSDHGFMDHPDRYFNVNAWLLQENYIGLKRNNASKLNVFSAAFNMLMKHIKHKNAKWRLRLREQVSRMPEFVRKWASEKYYQSNLIDWDHTRAFRFKMYGSVDGIVINQKGRHRQGVVEGGEQYERIRQEIIDKLLSLEDPDTGKKVVAEAFRREDLFQGEYLDTAPDIVIRLTPDYMGGVELQGAVITPVLQEIKNTLSGVHDHEGVFIYCSPNVKNNKNIDMLNITDVVPTILYDLKIPIPDDLDGRIALEIFHESFRVNSPEYVHTKGTDDREKHKLSAEDEESMKDSLRSLGYLE